MLARSARLIASVEPEVFENHIQEAIEMALRSLEENMQREGLTDLEKADAVKVAVELLEKAGIKGATERVAERLGLDKGWVSSLRKISLSMDNTERKSIEAGHLTAKTALAAKQWGGDSFVETLAARGKAAKPGQSLGAVLGRHGTNQHTRGDNNVISSIEVQGNSKTYTLARLDRDRPDLAERVRAGELSAHAAARMENPSPFQAMLRAARGRDRSS